MPCGLWSRPHRSSAATAFREPSKVTNAHWLCQPFIAARATSRFLIALPGGRSHSQRAGAQQANDSDPTHARETGQALSTEEAAGVELDVAGVDWTN
jgi:hypothetical protein